jgi:hypothetical protein
MAVKWENLPRDQVTAIGHNWLREVLDVVHLFAERYNDLARSRHILAYSRYYATRFFSRMPASTSRS